MLGIDVRIYRIHTGALDRLCSLWSTLVQMDNESAGFGVLDVWFIENLEIVPTLKQEIKEQKWMAKCMDEKSHSGISSKKKNVLFIY